MIEIKIKAINGEFSVSDFKMTGRRAIIEYEIFGIAKAITEELCKGHSDVAAIDIFNTVMSIFCEGCKIALAEHIHSNSENSDYN